MGSSFQYSVLAGFRAVDAWQQTIIQNVQGLLQPGYNRQKVHFGHLGGATTTDGNAPSQNYGGTNPRAGHTADSLAVTTTTLQFEQGTIDPAFSPSSLAIRGQGFFLLAENDQPGAKLYLTRNGDFHYDASGKLVNSQGLVVVGGRGVPNVDANGRLVGPPPLILNPGDDTVDLPQVTLAKVPSPSQLAISGYGSTVYEMSAASGPIRVFANGQQPQVGFVQASSIENPSRIGWSGMYQAETIQATQTYKIFKDMLTEFNKTTDDTINLIR